MNILVVNVGSTSLKYTLYREGTALARGKVQRIGVPGTHLAHRASSGETFAETGDRLSYEDAIRRMLDLLESTGDMADTGTLDAVGFKVVHGGRVSGTVRLTPEVVDEMEAYNLVAPAHNPPYVDAIRLFARVAPGVPLVGVFETGFHATLPAHVYTYGVPLEWQERYGIRRYGFHGASHGYIARRTQELLGEGLRVISCHLGGSSSVCAIASGRSMDVSMGYSPQGGPPQSSRCGDLDAFVALRLLQTGAYSVEELARVLTVESGLKGISGVGGDLRDLEEAAAGGNERARLALDCFVYEIRKLIGAYTAALEGVDVIVFTGGIGENGVDVRARVLAGFEFIGLELDAAANAAVRGREGRISADGSHVQVWVLPTDEELVVAGSVAEFLASGGAA
ncbi:MAG: acetate kinase [Thermoleophilia bacterium]